MIIKSEAHAKLLKTKDAELATLRAQLSSTHADLTQSEALVAHYKRTIDQLQAEGRATCTLLVKYLAVSQEHVRRVVQTLNFFLAYDKQKSLEVAMLRHDLRTTNNASSTICFVCRPHACLFCVVVCMSPHLILPPSLSTHTHPTVEPLPAHHLADQAASARHRPTRATSQG